MRTGIDAVKVLAIDQIANAKSGHPGMAISASTIAYTLYKNALNIAPTMPDFINRDRVVFSAGHCSALIYSILHLCGYNIGMNDLRQFRKYGSKTAGHPEVNVCEGIDASTGPLGQGIAMAVGMAMAERHLAGMFNKPNFPIIDHYTYVVCGEGCLMEGISYEACSLAGLHKLNKLIIIYDCNKITMDGSSDIAFTEDLCKRFEAQGFNTIVVKEKNSVAEIGLAISKAKESDKPSFIIVPSTIGEGTKNQGTNKVHGTPLSLDEAVDFRTSLGFNNELFVLPKEVYDEFKDVKIKGQKMVEQYDEMLSQYKKQYKSDYVKLLKCFEKGYEFNFSLDIKEQLTGRDLGQYALKMLNENVPNLFGGTADLMTSTKAYIVDGGDFNFNNPTGKNIHFGVREFAMSAICNGIALHGGLVPFCSTFLVFSDYMKASIRLSALMKQKVIYIFSHDSIEVGEDGPTHQPIEQLDALRSIPNLQVYRPACGSEVGFAYKKAYDYNGPTAIVLSKNKLQNYTVSFKEMEKGAYLVNKAKKPIANIFASGLEVGFALKVLDCLKERGQDANVISVVNQSVFDALSQKEKNKIVKNNLLTNVAIEASTACSLGKLVGPNGLMINIEHFGASADKDTLYKNFGFDENEVADKIIKKSFQNNDSIIPLFD